jgi:hypothetical protein
MPHPALAGSRQVAGWDAQGRPVVVLVDNQPVFEHYSWLGLGRASFPSTADHSSRGRGQH